MTLSFLKTRKKGSAILEFVLVLPLFILTIWSVMQILFFSSAQNILQNAAMDAARSTAMELRGQSGAIPHNAALQSKILSRIETTINVTGLILLFKDEKGIARTPTFVWENKNLCHQHLNNPAQKRVVCLYTQEIATRHNLEQVVVQVKAQFNIIGSFIPGLNGRFFADGKGVSQKEISGRFQYHY